MALERDPYRIIGVPPISKESEIKRAYREKSKLYHPDLNPDVRLWADEKMKELVEAYNIISEPEKKKAYDMNIHLQYRKERKRKKKDKNAKKEKSFVDKLKDFFKFEVSSPKKGAKGKKKDKKVEFNPKEAEINYGLGVSMCDNIGFLEQTIPSFKKATEYDPEHLEAHYNLGICYYKQGMWSEAISCFQQVLRIDSTDEGARHLISILKEENF